MLDWLLPTGFSPHGVCLLWRPELLTLHIAADLIIAAAYYSIPLSLFTFVRRRPDLRYRFLFVLFAVFITACGTNHLFAIVTLFRPYYGIEGLLKALTAIVSLGTAVALWPLLPRLVALPSPTQWEEAVAHLRRRLRIEGLVAQISTLFVHAEAAEIAEAITEALALAGKELEMDQGDLLLVADRQGTGVSGGRWCADPLVYLDLDLAGSALPWLTDRIQRCLPLQILHTKTLPDAAAAERAVLTQAGIGTLILLGMRYRGRPLGSLIFLARNPQVRMGEEAQHLLRMVAAAFTHTLVRQKAETTLWAERQGLREAQRIARLGSFEWEPRADRLTGSPEFYRILRLPRLVPESQEGIATLLGTLHPDDRAVGERLLRDPGPAGKMDLRILAGIGAGAERICEVQVEALAADDYGPERVRGTLRDVTEERAAQARLRQGAVVFEHSAEAILITDPDSRILAVNSAFTQITGYTEAEALGQTPRILKSGRHDPAFYQQLWTSLKTQGTWSGEIWDRRKSGEIYPKWLTISAVHDEAGAILQYVALFMDISAIKRSEEQLQFLAHHDALTSLPNRLLFGARLEHAIARAERGNKQLAVLFVDLDRFKDINDNQGHAVGDDLLKEVAQRLQGAVRKEDTVARLGGDEFIVIVEELAQGEDAGAVAEKIRTLLGAPYHIADQELFVSASIGISLYPADGQDPGSLVKNADVAMYRAKEDGRNTIHYYTAEIASPVRERAHIEQRLRRALEMGTLRLHYQPQISLAGGAVVAFEALLRWHDEELGAVSPAQFIPLAEDCGLVVQIGEWVLREACRQAVAWSQAGTFHGRVAVNLSGHHLQRPALVETLRAALEETGLTPARLEIEITEGAIMRQGRESAATLAGLRALGVGLSIDDFGTGYSSLSYLKRLPVDRIKIDRSFVRDIHLDLQDQTITRTVIALGHSLGLEVVAEGVESREQLEFLRAEGCDLVQGFFYSPALPPEGIHALLQTLADLAQDQDP
jgi:diguanylate cyclase (GGDEF)-like protein/PAS domain S-box-containing protein